MSEEGDIFKIIKKGDIEELALAIKKNPNLVNKTDSSGQIPLHLAILEDQLDIVEILLNTKTIDPNIQDNDGLVPLRLAISEGQIEITKALLKKEKIDLNAEYDCRRTLLYLAAKEKQTEITRSLLKAYSEKYKNYHKILYDTINSCPEFPVEDIETLKMIHPYIQKAEKDENPTIIETHCENVFEECKINEIAVMYIDKNIGNIHYYIPIYYNSEKNL